MEPKTDHIVAVPPIIRPLLYLQVFLSFAIVALSGYGLSAVGTLGASSFAIFVSLATVIIDIWYLVSTTKAPSLYNAIPVLTLFCIEFIWWLAAWASLTAWAAAYAFSDACYVGNCLQKRALFSWDSYRDCLAASAGAAILNFIILVVILVVYSLRFHRHRKSGAPWMYNGKWGNGATNGSGAGGPAQRLQTQPFEKGAVQQGPTEISKSGVVQSVQSLQAHDGQIQQGQTPMQYTTPQTQSPMPPQTYPAQQPTYFQQQPNFVQSHTPPTHNAGFPVTFVPQPNATSMPVQQYAPQQVPQAQYQYVSQQPTPVTYTPPPQYFVPQQQMYPSPVQHMTPGPTTQSSQAMAFQHPQNVQSPYLHQSPPPRQVSPVQMDADSRMPQA